MMQNSYLNYAAIFFPLILPELNSFKVIALNKWHMAGRRFSFSV